MQGVLSGIRVIDFTHMLAGPFCTALLRELGARIIKVEFGESGDMVRTTFPAAGGCEGDLFMTVNRGKKSVMLDLKTREARKVALDLIAEADILIEDLPPRVMRILGLDYKAVKRFNPKLIYCVLSGFGPEGFGNKLPSRGMDTQAVHGPMSFTGVPGNLPASCGPYVAVADTGGGPHAIATMMEALNHRDRTGVGKYLEISMQDCNRATGSLETEFLQKEVN